MNSAADALASSELEDVLNLRAAVIVLDKKGRVRLWNLAARPIFGVAAGDALDRPFEEVAGRRLGGALDSVMDALESRRSLRTVAHGDMGALSVAVVPNGKGNLIVVRPNESGHSSQVGAYR